MTSRHEAPDPRGERGRSGRSGRPDLPPHLDPPLAVHRAGEAALLAEYPDTDAVLAASAAVRELAPAHLVDLVPAERTLLLAGTSAQDLPVFDALLHDLPPAPAQGADSAEVTVGLVYDGEDLAEVAQLLGMSTQALVTAHSSARWTAAFGGFSPGFTYLVTAPGATAEDSPPWEVPRRAEPRSRVPAGAVGLASRYCGIYPRPSPGGWQLIGRSDAELFDVHRDPPALLSPGTRVRFAPQRPTVRASPASLARAAREVAAPGRPGRRRTGSTAPAAVTTVLEVLSPGPLTLIQDAGRPGLAAIGVSTSGAFDQAARVRANLAVGNPGRAPVLETLMGPLLLRATAPTVVATSGAEAPVQVHRQDQDGPGPLSSAVGWRERPIALDPGDRLTVGPAADGLRLVLAVRGGLHAGDGEELGSMSRDTLAGLGPAPLSTGDRLQVGNQQGLDAVPTVLPSAESDEPADAPRASLDTDPSGAEHSLPPLVIPVRPGPRDALLGPSALCRLFATAWTVRPDSDRVGVRLDGSALPLPAGLDALPSEPMMPGAIQVPPSGLPVVFGPDHPTTGGYPVIAVVTRVGQDRLAQAAPGTEVHFLPEG